MLIALFTNRRYPASMAERRLWYVPNPSHKLETTEAGPPRWSPKKTACPVGMSMEQRDFLVRESVPIDDDPLNPRRYAVRRVEGRLEWYRSLPTREHPDGRIEIHGHPFVPGYPKVPVKVLRRMRESGVITPSEYKDMVKA